MKIETIRALEIIDSRGNPTVKAYITLDDGSTHSAAVPSGASTGKYEAVELRDGNNVRYFGKGCRNAVNNINTTIYDVLRGVAVEDPRQIDKLMIEADGTENKAKLGANALLAVSLAANRAAAYSNGLPTWKFIAQYHMNGASPRSPGVFANVINGGKHAGWNFDIQEFILVVKKDSVSESIRIAAELFHALGSHLKSLGYTTLVGDEGGYSPTLKSNGEVFETLIESAKTLPYVYKTDWKISLDVAASEFYQDGQYKMMKDNSIISPEELMQRYMDLVHQYELFSIEDPFDQDDWDNFRKFTGALSSAFPPDAPGDAFSPTARKTYVVGDDFLVTNPKRIADAVAQNASSAGLIKLNQIGTVSETIEAIKLCKNAGWQVIVSHRSGETEDTFIADLAYGTAADYIKTGSMSRSERLAKYNRLMEIEAFEA